jgi:hypothetical protein
MISLTICCLIMYSNNIFFHFSSICFAANFERGMWYYLADMVRFGCQPDSYTVNTIINFYASKLLHSPATYTCPLAILIYFRTRFLKERRAVCELNNVTICNDDRQDRTLSPIFTPTNFCTVMLPFAEKVRNMHAGFTMFSSFPVPFFFLFFFFFFFCLYYSK